MIKQENVIIGIVLTCWEEARLEARINRAKKDEKKDHQQDRYKITTKVVIY